VVGCIGRFSQEYLSESSKTKGVTPKLNNPPLRQLIKKFRSLTLFVDEKVSA
jgi:hypothetical protein